MRFQKTETDLERFMRFVSPEPNTGCWLWLGGLDKDGYGKFATGPNRRQTHWRAHRWITNAPRGVIARHVCDTPPCANPAHVRHGTTADNVADRVAKRRSHFSDVGPAQRLEIAELRRRSWPVSSIAAITGFSMSFVYKVLR